MKKNDFFKITLLLIIGGFLTKILGMIIKIVMTRFIGPTGIGIYMMIMPTFSLLVAITQLGFPIAISKLVAENKYKNKKIILGIIPISLFINIIVMFLLILLANKISVNLLHEKRCYLGLISIALTLPFISISSILRAYFFGKTKIIPHVISNILEDVIRLILIIFFVPTLVKINIEYTVAFLFLISIASETSSIIIFLLCSPKKISIEKKDFVIGKNILKKILNISLPATGSRLIGSIGFFLEPIILTFVLSKFYVSDYFVNEYGIINGYVMPLILLPTFFTLAISQALIPIISKAWANNNKDIIKSKINQAIFYSLIIAIPATLIFMFIPEVPLRLLYKSTKGIMYIKALAPICLIYYIQSPLTSTLQAIDKASIAMKGTLYGMIVRCIILFTLSYLKIGLWPLIIATGANMLIVTFHHIIYIKKELN